MSRPRQLSLDAYFKSKSSNSPYISKPSKMNTDEVKVTKKRSLSLIKSVTPSKSPKVSVHDKNDRDVINLCSDDEENCSEPSGTVVPQKDEESKSISVCKTPTANDVKTEVEDSVLALLCDIENICSPKNEVESPRKTTDGNESDSSQKTVIYFSPKQENLSQTPTKTPLTPSSSKFRSPQSGNKYFSPNKKRAVYKKISVRKDLTQQLAQCDNNQSTCYNQNLAKCEDKKDHELFNDACLGLDDKTIFLLSIVNECINNHALWCLLDEESQNLLSRCFHVIKPGMRLVCRLYWHKEGWYKREKIRMILAGKEETIDDSTVIGVLQSLQENGFLCTDGHNLTFEDYTALLSAEELKEICKMLKLKISSKQGAIEALKNFSKEKSIANFFNTSKTNNNSARILKIMSSKVGPCYKLSDAARRAIYKLYILMYLGINYNVIKEKNLELILLYDKINRETYPVEDEMLDDASVVFKEKDEFESYLNAVEIYEAFQEEADLEKKVQTITHIFGAYMNTSENEMLRQKSVPEWLRRYTPLNLYIKILEAGIQDLKKKKDYSLALEILQMLISQDTFRQHKKSEWYAEKALVLQKNGQTEEAAEILLEGFKSDLSEEAKDAMRPRAKIIAKQTVNQEMKTELVDYANKEEILEKNLRGVHIYKQPMDRTHQKGKLKFETRISGERTVQDVEEYCLSEYLSSGEFTNGMHWEGRIVTTMFFLLFWDIIYWKPPDCLGVFLTRFQKFPLDLFCKSFYENRRDAIEARLSFIERCTVDEVLRIMQSKWCTRPETEHSGISRDSMSWEQVSAVASCLQGRALAALCRRLARDYRYSHSGFPDLTLWNTSTNKIRFVEVKSDTDRPSMKQIQWMHYLQQNDIDTEFCYVGVHTTRCKARSTS
ncbi:hypothetical protein ABMA28_006272 [Loxostege sticticalis]|uniref:Fanconi-associated nuclease n=1 Tax=Loxostege sticticalis TaxID=481309 RepID=A0ABD0SKK8_LOXSC